MKTINCKPLFNKVLVKVPPISEKTDSGIIKGDAVIQEEKKSPLKVEILAVGDDVKYVEVGTIVTPDPAKLQYSGIDILIEGSWYCVFPEHDIICIYPEDTINNIVSKKSIPLSKDIN